MYSSGLLFSLLLSFSIKTQILDYDDFEFSSRATERLIFVKCLHNYWINVEKTLIFTDAVCVLLYLSMSSVFYAILFVFLSISHKRNLDITETNSLKDIL